MTIVAAISVGLTAAYLLTKAGQAVAVIEWPRIGLIYYEGRFYSYSLRAFAALWNLSLVCSALCMASFMLTWLLRERIVFRRGDVP